MYVKGINKLAISRKIQISFTKLIMKKYICTHIHTYTHILGKLRGDSYALIILGGSRFKIMINTMVILKLINKLDVDESLASSCC